MSTTASQNIKSISAELRKYWEPVLARESASAYFTAKHSYKKPDWIARFFQSELNKGDIYVELINFDFDFISKSHRELYKVAFRSDWKEYYEEVTSGSTVSYIVPLSAMELVNKTPIGRATPLLATGGGSGKFSPKGIAAPSAAPAAALVKAEVFTPSTEEFAAVDLLEEPDDEMADQHQTAMTMRDLYCFIQNVPLSNKPWVNHMIHEGRRMHGVKSK